MLSIDLEALPTTGCLCTEMLRAVALSYLSLAILSSSSIGSDILTVGSHHLFTCRLERQFYSLRVQVGSEGDGDLGSSSNVLPSTV